MTPMLRLSEVGKHKTEDSCWMILHGNVYDITPFVPEHPGGRSILLENAGQDASEAFDAVHSTEILDEYLQPTQLLGRLDPQDAIQSASSKNAQDSQASVPAAPMASSSSSSSSSTTSPETVPPLSTILSISEIEAHAMKQLSPKALSYYVSATDDELTKAANNRIYRSITLRPRVFVDCTTCSLQTSILGHQVGLPIYVSPAALAKLAHPSGEAGIAAACARFGALQIISHNASLSPASIVGATAAGADGPGAAAAVVFAWQLYVLKDRAATERTLARIRGIPQIRFIVLTLDAPFPGKREADERFKMSDASGAPQQVWGTEGGLTWRATLAWLTRHTSLPIVLKGVQTHEDAYAATLFPEVKGIILSNHGGRALDTAPTPVQVLLEIRKFCPEVLQRVDVLVDGGIKRGTDVVKALALGAKGVGLGRAALYGLALGGQAGVERVLQILADETMTAMRLLGVQNTAQLGPRHINTSALNSQLFDGPSGLDDVERQLLSRL
ncbi:FMN-dependent dehydrogenase-domain-containing protein [Xylariomycetidae sp. FL2044]|nr:FMN-dependent dehydrogenase-domain-containing protein [Xylariomycetidae sp. FL2044]